MNFLAFIAFEWCANRSTTNAFRRWLATVPVVRFSNTLFVFSFDGAMYVGGMFGLIVDAIVWAFKVRCIFES